MTDQLIDRPSTWGTIGDHERRIRSLEALENCCSQQDQCVSFPDRISLISDAGAPLLGYWRLGGAGDPWADTSPFADADLSLVTAGTHHIVPDVTGCLVAGEDDGAVEFTGSAFANGDHLIPAVTTRFQFTNTAMGVACWVKLNTDCGAGSLSLIVGTYSPGNGGWAIATSGGRILQGFRSGAGGSGGGGTVGPAVALGDCNFIVYNWDPAGGHELFYNGVLVDSDPESSSIPNFSMLVGAMGSGGPVFGALDGVVDELSIWGAALTPDQINSLYLAGHCDPSSAGAGTVLTSDGSDGTSWEFPTIEVDSPGGRFNKIIPGTGLAGVDNGDDSVTLNVSGAPPSGAAGGDLAGTYPNPTLNPIGSATGPIGSTSVIPVVTIDTKGRVTALTSASPQIDTIGAGTDILTNNVSTSKHGLTPKLPNDATKFLNGVGAYAVPPTGSTPDDSYVWMPLTSTVSGDDVLVFDADHSLIPTLIPF